MVGRMMCPPGDDPRIPDAEHLYRGVLPNHFPGGRLSSLAFGSAKDTDISVDLGSKTTPEQTLRRLSKSVGVVLLTARQARGVPGVSGVIHDPSPDNDAHGEITRAAGVNNSQWKTVCRELAMLARWAIYPTV